MLDQWHVRSSVSAAAAREDAVGWRRGGRPAPPSLPQDRSFGVTTKYSRATAASHRSGGVARLSTCAAEDAFVAQRMKRLLRRPRWRTITRSRRRAGDIADTGIGTRRRCSRLVVPHPGNQAGHDVDCVAAVSGATCRATSPAQPPARAPALKLAPPKGAVGHTAAEVNHGGRREERMWSVLR
jgi:hypothetical protein